MGKSQLLLLVMLVAVCACGEEEARAKPTPIEWVPPTATPAPLPPTATLTATLTATPTITPPAEEAIHLSFTGDNKVLPGERIHIAVAIANLTSRETTLSYHVTHNGELCLAVSEVTLSPGSTRRNAVSIPSEGEVTHLFVVIVNASVKVLPANCQSLLVNVVNK